MPNVQGAIRGFSNPLDYYYMKAGQVEQLTGWDRDVVFAQWILETGNFTSPNFRHNNNIAGQTWTPNMPLSMRGTPRPANEGGYYIKYKDPVDGYVDFIRKNDRYKRVPLINSEHGQIEEIARAGWAVDPLYANKLKNILEQNKKKGYHTEARSVIEDPKKWVKGNLKGLHPALIERLMRVAKQWNKPIEIESGFRSFAEQKKLYNKYKAGKGNLAAEPGTSAHNFGLAVDVKGWAVNLPEHEYIKFGLHKPVKSPQFEPWHIEPIETKTRRGMEGFKEALKILDEQYKGENLFTTIGKGVKNVAKKLNRNGTSFMGSVENMQDGAFEIFKAIDDLMSWDEPNLSDITRPFEFLAENGKALASRTLVTFIGVLLIAFGLLAMINKR